MKIRKWVWPGSPAPHCLSFGWNDQTENEWHLCHSRQSPTEECKIYRRKAPKLIKQMWKAILGCIPVPVLLDIIRYWRAVKSHCCTSSFPWRHLHATFSWAELPSKARKWHPKEKSDGWKLCLVTQTESQNEQSTVLPQCSQFQFDFKQNDKGVGESKAFWLNDMSASLWLQEGARRIHSLKSVSKSTELLVKGELKHYLSLTYLIINGTQNEKQ